MYMYKYIYMYDMGQGTHLLLGHFGEGAEALGRAPPPCLRVEG